jgi:hypothetical protein
MVVNELDFVSVVILPAEAEAPLVVDSDGVLTLAIALQRFEPVAREGGKVVHVLRVTSRVKDSSPMQAHLGLPK